MKEVLKVLAIGLVVTFSIAGCSSKEVKLVNQNSYEVQKAAAEEAWESLDREFITN